MEVVKFSQNCICVNYRRDVMINNYSIFFNNIIRNRIRDPVNNCIINPDSIPLYFRAWSEMRIRLPSSPESKYQQKDKQSTDNVVFGHITLILLSIPDH